MHEGVVSPNSWLDFANALNPLSPGISISESNTVVSAYKRIGTYNSIALTHRYVNLIVIVT